MKNKNTHICQHCGNVCTPRKLTKGSFGMEIILWIMFLFPGVLYSIWRLTTRYWGCPYCHEPDPVLLDTPRGRSLLAQYPQDV